MPDLPLDHYVQGQLSLEEDQVEMWVIQAIGKKLIDAQIDQLNERVTVLKCARTTFGNSQWVELQQQLNAWKVSNACLGPCADLVVWPEVIDASAARGNVFMCDGRRGDMTYC